MKHIISPCKHVCVLDHGVCIGCGRTANEIGAWCSLSDSEREVVMRRVIKAGQAVCPCCGGEGFIDVEVQIMTAGCCGVPNPDGSCCGNAIPIPDVDLAQAPCPLCGENDD